MARRATVLAAGLPALAFTEAEIDALLLGLTMAATIEDEEVSEPALAARRRIAEALPPEPAYRPRRSDTPLERTLCAAMAAEQRLRLRYTDGKGVATDRVVWPATGCSPPGAKRATTSGISGSIASPRRRRPESVTRRGGACWRPPGCTR